MTTTFDALQHILQKYKGKMEYHDYKILSEAIDAIHELQHSEGTHRLDTIIEQRIVFRKEFESWRRGRDPAKKS